MSCNYSFKAISVLKDAIEEHYNNILQTLLTNCVNSILERCVLCIDTDLQNHMALKEKYKKTYF